MNITLRKITGDNFDAVIALKVEKYCASNVFSLAQAKVYPEPEAIPLAIYHDDTPVGFIMYGIDPQDNEYWIIRLMIDEKHQKKGYGKAAMDLIMEKIKQDTSHNKIKLSTNPENSIGRKFYTKLGFRDTGEIIDGELLFILDY